MNPEATSPEEVTTVEGKVEEAKTTVVAAESQEAESLETTCDKAQKLQELLATKLNRQIVGSLVGCIHCGMCAEACHFYANTKDPKYTPVYKVDLLVNL